MAVATRRTRRSADETRAQLVTAALDHLELAGMAAQLDSISLEEAVRSTGVARSSAYSAWGKVADGDQTPQVAFQREVMRQAILRQGLGPRSHGPMIDATTTVLARRGELEPADMAVELIRLAIEAQFVDAATRRGYRVSLALSALAASVPDDAVDTEVVAWLRTAEIAYMSQIEDIFRWLADQTDMQPRPELDGPEFWLRFATAVIALGEGLFPRLRTADHGVLFGIPGPGLDGQTVDWSLYALGVHALFERFFEPGEPTIRL